MRTKWRHFRSQRNAVPQRRFRVGPALRRPAVTSLVMVTALVLAVPLLGSPPAAAAQLIPRVTGEANMVDVAFDSAGNLYESETNGDVNVWPTASTTIFGEPVISGQANTLVTLHDTPGLAFDASGDLFIADDDGSGGGSISVLAQSSGTVFGQAVTANTLSPIVTGLDAPVGMAFDAAGNLYYATQNDINVLPATSGTLYGESVTANTPAVLVSGLTEGAFLTFDAASPQDLFYTDLGNGNSSVNVLPGGSTGTIFGHSVTADTPTTLVSDLSNAAGLAMDGQGNLYVDYNNSIGVLSNDTGSLYATPVPANTLTPIAVGLLGDLGATFSSGSLFVADEGLDSVDQLLTPNASISSVTIGGSEANPIVTVTGTGFNTVPPTYPPSQACSGPDVTGEDYDYGNLYLSDDSGSPWDAGNPGDCVGLTAAQISGTKMVFGLGSSYASGSAGFQLNSGDPFTVGVDGTTFSGTVSYTSPSSADVTQVKADSGPGGGGTVVTLKGTDLSGTRYVFFGDEPATHVTVVSSNKVTAVAPPGSGTVTVEPVTNSDEVGSSSASFTYVPPAITSISPAKGQASGGETVTITGTDLIGTLAVAFGATAAESFTVLSDTEVQAVTPAESAGTVSVTVTTPAGTSNGASFRFK